MAVVVDGSSSYGRSVFRGVMRYANAQRRWMIFSELRRREFDTKTLPACAGAIIAGAPNELLAKISRRTKHFIHCSAAADVKRGPMVCLDDLQVGRLAAEHLLDCRLQHFGFFGTLGWKASDQRAAGFCEVLKARGYPCLMSPAQWPGLEAQTVKEERRLVSWVKSLPRPIGILAVDDSAACDLAAACLKAGIIVPDEIAIIGVNNDDLLCQSAWPPLSSVEGDFSRVGYTAAVILDRLLSGEKIPIDQRTVLVPPLGIVRRLRGCFRTGRSIESCGGIPPDRADTARLREVVKQPPSTDVLAVDDPQLSQAVSFIREHACDPCSIEDVLNHIAVGRRWLERQFALKLNRTPHDEILRVQMDAAKRLLLQPGLPIEDIATRCGFSSAPSLGRAFVRSFKITPAAFRRRSITIV